MGLRYMCRGQPTPLPPPPSGYNFKFFIAPSNGGTLGNDANDGRTPTVTGLIGVGGRNQGPWTIGSLLNSQIGGFAGISPTATQAANNALMSGNQVGVVGDQGVVSLADAGITYPTVYGGNGNLLSLPSGTATNQTVLASCNSLGQYVRGLAVLDGGVVPGTTNNGMVGTNIISSLDFVGRSDTGTNCQYITVDGFEIRNCTNAGICFRQAGSLGTTLPGWVAINNFVHSVYNCNEGSAVVGSVSGGILTVTSVTAGIVRPGNLVFNPIGNGTGLSDSSGVRAYGTGGTTGTGGLGTYSIGGTAVFSGNITTSTFGGNNLAGISFHGGSGPIVQNNFIQDVIDTNTMIQNNIRAAGIKHWTCINSLVQFNTIYSTAAKGFPTGGIEHKNIPQWNNTISNNYFHLANAVNNPFDVISVAVDGESSTTVTVPNGHFTTVNNNIFIGNPLGGFGCPTDIGGGNTQALLINWFNNTCVLTNPAPTNGLWTRNGPVTGQNTLNYHDNILDRANPPTGNGNDFRTQLGNINHIDFNLWPSNYNLNIIPNAGGNGLNYTPTQNGGIAGAMAVLTGATGLEHNGQAVVTPELGQPIYVNASRSNFANKKASDWQLAAGPGKGTGTAGNDKGAWGTAGQIGCNWRDPSG